MENKIKDSHRDASWPYLLIIGSSPIIAGYTVGTPLYGPLLKASLGLLAIGGIMTFVCRDSKEKKYSGMAALAGLLQILLIVPVTGFASNRAADQYSQCKENLDKLCDAAYLYEYEHQRPAERLEDLVSPETLLEAVPICPAAGKQTYQIRTEKDETIFFCQGNNHKFHATKGRPDLPSERVSY